MSDYNEKLKGLSSRLKTETVQSKIQEVRPVKHLNTDKVDETQLNVWIPKTLMKKLRQHAIEQDKSIREEVLQAINSYLIATKRQ